MFDAQEIIARLAEHESAQRSRIAELEKRVAELEGTRTPLTDDQRDAWGVLERHVDAARDALDDRGTDEARALRNLLGQTYALARHRVENGDRVGLIGHRLQRMADAVLAAPVALGPGRPMTWRPMTSAEDVERLRAQLAETRAVDVTQTLR